MKNEINIDAELKRAEDAQTLINNYTEFLKAKQYLINLFQTAKYQAIFDDDERFLFSSVAADQFNGNRRYRTASKEVQKGAKHHKDIMDFWPSWKTESYKQAKIYDKHFEALKEKEFDIELLIRRNF